VSSIIRRYKLSLGVSASSAEAHALAAPALEADRRLKMIGSKLHPRVTSRDAVDPGVATESRPVRLPRHLSTVVRAQYPAAIEAQPP
jgi:hypothetical protein